MLKRPITYTTFDGEKVTEEFYFNISKAELIKLELSEKDGLKATIEKIVAAKDLKNLIQEFEKIVLGAYGVKSEDGKRFIKTPELREEFSQTAAFDALFMELATDDTAASLFIQGILPADMIAELSGTTPQDKPVGPPKGLHPAPPMPPSQ